MQDLFKMDIDARTAAHLSGQQPGLDANRPSFSAIVRGSIR